MANANKRKLKTLGYTKSYGKGKRSGTSKAKTTRRAKRSY